MKKQVAALKAALTALRIISESLQELSEDELEAAELLLDERLWPLAQITEALRDAGVSDEEIASL